MCTSHLCPKTSAITSTSSLLRLLENRPRDPIHTYSFSIYKYIYKWTLHVCVSRFRTTIPKLESFCLSDVLFMMCILCCPFPLTIVNTVIHFDRSVFCSVRWPCVLFYQTHEFKHHANRTGSLKCWWTFDRTKHYVHDTTSNFIPMRSNKNFICPPENFSSTDRIASCSNVELRCIEIVFPYFSLSFFFLFFPLVSFGPVRCSFILLAFAIWFLLIA